MLVLDFLYDPLFSETLANVCRSLESYNPERSYWIAGQKLNPYHASADFVWRVISTDRPVFGDVSLMNYTNWYNNFPTGFFNVNCAYLYYAYASSTETVLWKNTECNHWMCFICELDVTLRIEWRFVLRSEFWNREIYRWKTGWPKKVRHYHKSSLNRIKFLQ